MIGRRKINKTGDPPGLRKSDGPQSAKPANQQSAMRRRVKLALILLLNLVTLGLIVAMLGSGIAQVLISVFAVLIALLITVEGGSRTVRKHPVIFTSLLTLLALAVYLLSNHLTGHLSKDFVPSITVNGIPHDASKGLSWNEYAIQGERRLRQELVTGAQMAGDLSQYDFKEEFSIIIVARNEDDYLVKTIQFTLKNTPERVVREIIVVDDASNVPQLEGLEKGLSPSEKKFIKLIRFDEPQGLIRARIAGADAAVAPNIFFLDGHCRPNPGWEGPLLKHLKANYKRLACPTILDIKRDTWADVGTQGLKMMFGWDFEFDWYDDNSDEVPISAGGILAMTRRWWHESGKYDPGMREWGGENLEQSMRVWMCGGEIYVSRDSFVGHIFDRPPKPNPNNSLVKQVQTNQKRAALVWLDDYYQYFEQTHFVTKYLDEGPGIEQRQVLRSQLGCHNFQWYVDKFRAAFERRGLLLHHFHHLRHQKSRWCLTSVKHDPATPKQKPTYTLALQACVKDRGEQRWQPVAGGRLLYNQASKKCLDTSSKPVSGSPVVFACNWSGILEGTNINQLWLYEEKSKRLFTHSNKDFATPTGNDYYTFSPELARNSSSMCLASELAMSQQDINKMLEAYTYEAPVHLEACAEDKKLTQEWKWIW